MEVITLSIQPRAPVSLKLSNPQGAIGLTLGVQGGWSGATYEGAYEVTPQISSQSLATANKVMRSNVLINGIPYFETSNTSGTTAIIGG